LQKTKPRLSSFMRTSTFTQARKSSQLLFANNRGLGVSQKNPTIASVTDVSNNAEQSLAYQRNSPLGALGRVANQYGTFYRWSVSYPNQRNQRAEQRNLCGVGRRKRGK